MTCIIPLFPICVNSSTDRELIHGIHGDTISGISHHAFSDSRVQIKEEEARQGFLLFY